MKDKKAVCQKCNAPRLTNNDTQWLTEGNFYIPVCQKCFDKIVAENLKKLRGGK